MEERRGCEEESGREEKGGRMDGEGGASGGGDGASGAFDEAKAYRSNDISKFKAVLRKNFVLKTRGIMCCCSGAEVLAPIILFLLLCLPRLLIGEDKFGVQYFDASPIFDASWAGDRACPDGNGYKIVYTPSGDPDVERVSKEAALKLYCSSFINTLGFCAAYDFDAEKLEAEGGLARAVELAEECRRNPDDCGDEFVVESEEGQEFLANITQAFIDNPVICDPSCRNNPSCAPIVDPVLDLFLVGAETMDAAEEYILDVDNRGTVLGIVGYDNTSGGSSSAGGGAGGGGANSTTAATGVDLRTTPTMTYTLRLNGSDIPFTTFDFAFSNREPDNFWKNYFSFVNVQNAIDEALINFRLSLERNFAINLIPSIKEYPFPSYKTNYSGVGASLFFGQVFVFAYLTTVVLIMRGIVHEKELRIREGMKIMGLSDKTYWLTWFITNFVTLFIAAIAMAVIGLYPFQNSNAAVLLLFYVLFACELIFFSYFITTFFNSSRTAAIVGSFLYILSWAPGVASFIAEPEGSTGWAVSALAPASAVFVWGNALAIQENSGEGIQWGNLSQQLTREGNFSAGLILVFVSVSIVMYLFLAWYFDKVLPKEYGTRYPPWFLFSSSYWRERQRKHRWRHSGSVSRTDDDADASHGNGARTRPSAYAETDDIFRDGSNVIEAAPARRQRAICIRDLVKTFGFVSPSSPTQQNGSNDSRRAGDSRSGGTAGGGSETVSLSSSEGGEIPASAAAGPMSPGRSDHGTGFFGRWMAGFRGWFQNPGIVAVDGLNLDVYDGQITALLGPNGAGKTTTISMLTGMIESNSGDITVNGLSLKEGLGHIRKSMGVCPQFDILWPTLTVFEHLQIYASFKGIPSHEMDATIFRAIQEVDLLEKTDELSSRLSGGQRRKLSLAIAFIGGPKVVILDEPTSGMDPYARRKMWEVISRFKKGRTILLTTHFMDEADLLSDRIAIMAKGNLVCYGSSLFLKSKFGAGYSVNIDVKKARENEKVRRDLSDTVTSHVPKAYLQSAAGSELSFLLPSDSTSQFSGLLEELQRLQDDGRIGSYGISCSTLEDVFLAIAEGSQGESRPDMGLEIGGAAAEQLTSINDIEDRAEQIREIVRRRSMYRAAKQSARYSAASEKGGDGSGSHMTSSVSALHASDDSGGKSSRASGRGLRVMQFFALLNKRFVLAKRDKISLLTMYTVPVLFVVFAMALSLLSAPNLNQPPILLGPEYLDYKPVIVGTSDGYTTNGTGANELVMSRYMDPPGFFDSGADFMYNCSEGGPDASDTLLSVLQDIIAAQANNETFNPGSGNGRRRQCTKNTTGSLDELLLPRGKYPCNTGPPEASCGALFIEEYTQSGTFEHTVMSQGSAYHGLPTGLNMINDAISLVLVNTSIDIINHPMPSTEEEGAESRIILDSLLALCVVIAGASLSASFSIQLVQEKGSGSKHIQLVSGIHQTIFWWSNILWDLVNFLVPATLMIIIIIIFNVSTYQGSETRAAIYVLLLAFGWASIPLAYVLHFPFDNDMNCLASQMGGYFFVGLVFVLAGIILETLQGTSQSVDSAWDALQWIFRILPHYNLGKGLYNIAQNASLSDRFEQSPWNLSVTGWELIFLAWQGPFFFILTLLIEYGGMAKLKWCLFQLSPYGCCPICPPCLICMRPMMYVKRRVTFVRYEYHNMLPPITNSLSNEHEDEDVALERSRIDNADGSNPDDDDDIIVARSLRKTFYRNVDMGNRVRIMHDANTKVAVRNLTFGVRRGHVFGLLGVNGAGKSTTFKMLTGEFPPTSGDAFVHVRDSSGKDKLSIVNDKQRARQHMGYCPQYDALLHAMTVREHLRFYTRVRGIDSATGDKVVDGLMKRLNLANYADRSAGTLSGGNKRKLSVAIALVGDPSVVLLDEPSTGMDPEARRFLWDVISEVMVDRAVVLTSHSMEECESLCSNVGIMVNGEFRALGSVQHLKSKFGDGYNIDVRIQDASARAVQRMKTKILTKLLGCAQLVEEHTTLLKYRIAKTDMDRSILTVARLFDIMEELKAGEEGVENVIEDYSISQTALEQVFLAFAKHQTQEDEEDTSALLKPGGGADMSAGGIPPHELVVVCPYCQSRLAWQQDAERMKCGNCGQKIGLGNYL